MAIIAHIGYPKTATSWFQNYFFPNIKNAYYIPNKEFIEFIKQNSLTFDANYFRNMLISITKNKLGNKKKIIISKEGIIGTTHNFGINGYLTKENAIRLHEIFPSAKILLFIRKQPDIIASSYIQYIKGGGTWGINKYLFHKSYSNINGFNLFSFEHFEYNYIIDLYTKLFGSENVKIFLYESFAENPQKFIKDLSDILNFEIDFNKIIYKKDNPAYRKMILLFAKILNRFTKRKMLNKYYIFHVPYLFSFSQIVLKSLNKIAIFGPYLTPEKILGKGNLNFIENYYKKSNKILVEKYGINEILKYGYKI